MAARGSASDRDPRCRYAIWVSCDDCGDVAVAGEECALIRMAPQATLAYSCPQCGFRATALVPEADCRRLVARGFVVREAFPALELTERHPVAATFTWDDVLVAHEALARAQFVVDLFGE
jgi:predicted RNA-binding Zn-ribbon protein involved in translation (DUF1610 family)